MRVLFATDGSREAQAAAQLLMNLPLEAEDPLTLLTVVPSDEGGESEGVLAPPYPEGAVDILAGTRDLLCHTPASLRQEVRRGHAGHEILDAAAAHQAELVVIGACGLSPVSRFLLGSVADRVVRHARCPVLVVRPGSAVVRRVVVGIDDSPSSTRAAKWLRGFPLPSEAEVRLVTVVQLLESWLRSPALLTPPLVDHVTTLAQHERDTAQERLHALAAGLTTGDKPAVTEIRSGDPTLALLQVAEEEGADLVVVGSHGQSAIERFLLGSVSEKVLQHAHCSVLVVR
jgi:nucleotide-binding universal stress UspA family protein